MGVQITNEFSKEIWKSTYLCNNEEIDDALKRVAYGAAKYEKDRERYEKEFYDAISNLRFCPAGRILSNLGVSDELSTTLFNCFIHHPSDIKMKDPDSIEGIYSLLSAQALTLKSEGGYGTNFSFIRPRGSYVKGVGSRTPGVLKFMELWDKSSEIITMGGDGIRLDEKRNNEKNKIRKGAQMAVLNVNHVEIEDYIVAKQTANRLTKFNMSVGITKGFMECVINDTDWNLIFPDTNFKKYNDEWNGDFDKWIEKGYPMITYKTVKARDLWDKIMISTYNRAEPGVIFLDIANEINPLYYAETIHGSNPCGEVVMGTGVCNLGSLNLPFFVKFDKNNKPYFDFSTYKKTVKTGIRFLDNINDLSKVPLTEYKIAIEEKRRIGLGNMGLGSLHFILGIRYGSKESLELIEKIYKIKSETEILTSAEIGKEKGNFLLFDKDKHFTSKWWKNLNIDPKVKKQVEEIGCMRNSHQSMNAPTGNTGVAFNNVSGGIEPCFLREYMRWTIVTDNEKLILREKGMEFCNPLLSEWFETKDFKFANRGNEKILEGVFDDVRYEIDKNRGLIKGTLLEDYGWKIAKEIYKDNLDEMIKNGIFATTEDLLVSDHINTLKIIAHYTNMSNSKTVNVPHDYPFEDFKNIYMDAWKNNIKGITTYRAGTMSAVLESTTETGVTHDNRTNNAPKRKKELDADIYSIVVKGVKYCMAVGLQNGKPYEMFGGLMNGLAFKFSNKKGKIIKLGRGKYKLEMNELEVENFAEQFKPEEQLLFRMISMNLRHGIDIKFVVEQLQKATNDMTSITSAASRVLKKYIKDGEIVTGDKCAQCGSNNLVYTEGCVTCHECNWSKCG